LSTHISHEHFIITLSLKSLAISELLPKGISKLSVNQIPNAKQKNPEQEIRAAKTRQFSHTVSLV